MKFLMGKQVRAAGCPGEGEPKRRGGGGSRGGRESSSQRGTQIPKAATRFEEGGFFYEGIVKCALSFPFAGENKGPHSI